MWTVSQPAVCVPSEASEWMAAIICSIKCHYWKLMPMNHDQTSVIRFERNNRFFFTRGCSDREREMGKVTENRMMVYIFINIPITFVILFVCRKYEPADIKSLQNNKIFQATITRSISRQCSERKKWARIEEQTTKRWARLQILIVHRTAFSTTY